MRFWRRTASNSAIITIRNWAERFSNLLIILSLNRPGIGTSNVEHMDLASLDRKQHAITVYYHLANFFEEFII